SFGASDVADTDIVVLPPVAGNNPPVAVPEATPNPVDPDVVVDLIDHDSYDIDAGDLISEYAWDFDVADGRTYTDSISALPDQASTSYANAGTEPITITASLQVKDSFGAVDTTDLEIIVNAPMIGGNHPPVAVAEAIATTVDSNELVEFIDSNSYDPDPSPDKVVEYAWDFDVANGRTYTDKVSAFPNRATTTYTNTTANPVQITASLQVKDTFGLTDFEDIFITVNPGLIFCSTPLNSPTLFRAPVIPDPPYSDNYMGFAWNAPVDPNGCLLGYAVWRSSRTGADNSWRLLSDLDADNQLDANEITALTSFSDTTWGEAGFPTTNKYYKYVVRSVAQGPGSTLLQSTDSNPINIYVNDFEGMSQLSGGTFRGTRSGMSWGLVNALAYPDLNAFNYGFEIATDEGHSGTHCLDESADVAAGGYGPTNHDPYAAASNFDDGIDDGYWNTFGPQLFTDLDDSLLPSGATVKFMQLFHKYQMETYFDPNQGVDVAADMGYVTVTAEADWELNKFNKLIDLPITSGKGYDSAAPGVNPFLDQTNWPVSQRDPTKQVPKMNFLAGEERVPGTGQLDWGKSVFDLTPARNMSKPVVQFCFAGDEYAQIPSQFGWSIDDILVVSY
ncbi:MAG: hypothetical protein ABI743_00005, partial [bacterium]